MLKRQSTNYYEKRFNPHLVIKCRISHITGKKQGGHVSWKIQFLNQRRAISEAMTEAPCLKTFFKLSFKVRLMISKEGCFSCLLNNRINFQNHFLKVGLSRIYDDKKARLAAIPQYKRQWCRITKNEKYFYIICSPFGYWKKAFKKDLKTVSD